MTDVPPLRVTLAGREKYEAEHVEDPPEEWLGGTALPAPCIRRLTDVGDLFGCPTDCPGRQRDGGCCADLVRGLELWQFQIDQDGYWVLL